MPRVRTEPGDGARAKVEERDESRLLDDAAAVLSLTAAAFMFLSFFAYQRELTNLNFAGRVGQGLADVVVQALGYAAYLVPLYLAVIAVLLFRHVADALSIARAAAALVLLLCTAVLLATAAPTSTAVPSVPNPCASSAARKPPSHPPANVTERSVGGGAAVASSTAVHSSRTSAAAVRAIDRASATWRNNSTAMTAR